MSVHPDANAVTESRLSAGRADMGIPETGAGPATVGLVSPLDMRLDAHVHTAFAAGRDSVGVIVTAAERAGLSQVVFADQAGPDTGWLRAYQDALRRAQQRTELTLRVAIEVEAVRADGWLDFPADLAGLEAVSVAVSHLPLPSGLAAPREVRALLRSGVISRTEVAERLVETTARALDRACRYAPAQLARPLGLLTRLGFRDDEVDDALIDTLVAACRASGSSVELSEAWRVPSPRLASRLVAAGVNLLPASDGGDASQVGRWQYVRSVDALLTAC